MVCLGKGIDSGAESEGDSGVVKDYIKEYYNYYYKNVNIIGKWKDVIESY